MKYLVLIFTFTLSIFSALYGQKTSQAQNNDETLSTYKKAATNGDKKAAVALGWLYETGDGVSQDSTEAVRWYAIASKDYVERAKKRISYTRLSKKSGKQLAFSSIHNFNAVFLPGNDKIVLNAAYDFENNYEAMIYTADYRIIDLNTMQSTPVRDHYFWLNDPIFDNKKNATHTEMLQMSAYAPGTAPAPDSMNSETLGILNKVMTKIGNHDYVTGGWFISRLKDGSLIYAVAEVKIGKDGMITLYRQPNVTSPVLEKYFVINEYVDVKTIFSKHEDGTTDITVNPTMVIYKPNIVISEDGKRVMYFKYGFANECFVYDIPSKKKLSPKRNYFNNSIGDLVKFTPDGDTLISFRSDISLLTKIAVRTGIGSDVRITDSIIDNFRKAADENSEEYIFLNVDSINPDKKFALPPELIDFTPDLKHFLVKSSNKLAIVSIDGSPIKFVSTPGIDLQYVIAKKVYTEKAYKNYLAIKTEFRKKVNDEIARRQAIREREEYYKRVANERAYAQEKEDREASFDEEMAEYHKKYPNGISTLSQADMDKIIKANSPTKAQQDEAIKHQRAMDKIFSEIMKIKTGSKSGF